MCLAMCLKKQEFPAGCVNKLGVYKKKVCIYRSINQRPFAILFPGLKYFEDFEERIPRPEMEVLEDCLKQLVISIDSKYVATVCGSFRRGAASSGDIDVLLTHADYDSTQPKQPQLLKAVVEMALDSGFATDQISLGDTKFMGVCRVPDSMAEVSGVLF